MKVLITANGVDIGGAETYVCNLAIGLKKEGIDPIVISNGGAFEENLKKHSITHIHAPLFNKDIISLIKAYKTINKVITQQKIDIVHAHARIPAIICQILTSKHKKPFIVTAHAKFKYNIFYKYTSFWGDRTTCISDDLKKYLITNYKINENKIDIIENGIDTNLFRKLYTKKETDIKKIITVSRLDKPLGKTCKKIIKAVSILDKKKNKIELNIIGDGEYYPILRDYVNELDLKNSTIHLLGQKTDIYRHLQDHDLAVCVSRSAMEAMSCELPIVLAGGEGYMGILTDKNIDNAKQNNLTARGYYKDITVDNIARDIESVLYNMNEDQRQKMGKYNRDIIINNYSLENMVKKTLQSYEKVLEVQK